MEEMQTQSDLSGRQINSHFLDQLYYIFSFHLPQVSGVKDGPFDGQRIAGGRAGVSAPAFDGQRIDFFLDVGEKRWERGAFKAQTKCAANEGEP